MYSSLIDAFEEYRYSQYSSNHAIIIVPTTGSLSTSLDISPTYQRIWTQEMCARLALG